MTLTAKQAAFVDEYLKTKNATQAAIAAGYSPKTAHAIGWENLRKPEIDEVIRQRFAENAMSADEVLSLLAEQARGSMDDFVTFHEGVKMPFLDLAKAHVNGKMRLVKKLKYTDQGGIEFELYDAHAAMVDIGRVHKLFVDRAEIMGKDGGDIIVRTVDYRNGLAQIATGSDDDSGASSED